MKRIIRALVFFATLIPVWAMAQTAQSDGYQFPYPVATDRILIGYEPGTSTERLAEILAKEPVLLPFNVGMQAQENMLIGWIVPAITGVQAPTQENLHLLLDRLEQAPEIRFAHPFIATGNDLRGLTARVVLKMKPGASISNVSSLLEDMSLLQTGKNAHLRDVYYLDAGKHATVTPIQAAQALQQHSLVAYADVDYLLNPVVHSNDALFNTQWSLHNTGSAQQGNGTPDADMDVQEAWALTRGDSSIRVAIIDCGIDTLHPDLMGNLLPGHDATGGNSKGYPNTNFPSDGHGTSCAGIVAAKGENSIGISGVCPECRVFPVKVFYYLFNPFGDPLPYASGTAMADAISWAWQVGDADVLSSSWGLFDNLLPLLPGGTTIVEDAIAMALDSARDGKGGLLFFSSGNDGGAPLWPGRIHGCFSINATTMCDERKYPASCDGQNWEGNWGDSLDVSAPGVLISATDMTGSNGYEPGDYTLEFGGTSAACPNAAGVMGLVLSVRPDVTLETAHFLLESTCDKVGGYTYAATTSSGTHSSELGYGRLNAFAAVSAAQSLVEVREPAADGTSGLNAWYNAGAIELKGSMKPSSPVQVTLYDLQGRAVFTWNKLHSHEQSYRLLLPHEGQELCDGIYLVQVLQGATIQCRKILINN